jgi:BASS family bile acid:Na+ symporter
MGLMMLGLSLELRVEDFRRVFLSHRPLVVGLVAQLLLLPGLTYLLVLILKPAPSVALGILLIGVCPGANLSNSLTYIAMGNTALSITLTVLSTAASIVTIPLLLGFWASLDPGMAALLRKVSMDPMEVYMGLMVILGFPMFLGMTLSGLLSPLFGILRRAFRGFMLVVMLVFIAMSLSTNWEVFRRFNGLVVFAVLLHNTLALALGWFCAMAMRLKPRDLRAVCLEVGTHNLALGLILIFNFFDGLGGMAVVATWWGPWSVLSGLSVALFMSRRPLPGEAPPADQVASGDPL